MHTEDKNDAAAFEPALQASERYVHDIALPHLKEAYPEIVSFVAIGLVGNGSECFGYDDELSKDHDWGIDFFLWLPEEKASYLDLLTQWKQVLFRDVPPAYMRAQSEYGAKTAVMLTRDFYRMLIGTDAVPQSIRDWIRIPDENLAMVVNGRVFFDEYGEFSRIRNELLEYYPEDLRLKRLATACMLAAQAGQYNFLRSAKRHDIPTMHRCVQRFVDQVEKLVFLMNRTYKPYYKWSFKALGELPLLGHEIAEKINELCSKRLTEANEVDEASHIIEDICLTLERELVASGLSTEKDSYLQTHGESVFTHVQDPWVKSLPITFEVQIGTTGT